MHFLNTNWDIDRTLKQYVGMAGFRIEAVAPVSNKATTGMGRSFQHERILLLLIRKLCVFRRWANIITNKYVLSGAY